MNQTEAPGWVRETPDECTYDLTMFDPGGALQPITLTRSEFVSLKSRLAELRRYTHAEGGATGGEDITGPMADEPVPFVVKEARSRSEEIAARWLVGRCQHARNGWLSTAGSTQIAMLANVLALSDGNRDLVSEFVRAAGLDPDQLLGPEIAEEKGAAAHA